MINLKKKRKGIGGIFFISVTMSCAFIMMFVISISRQSTVISMADNIAHVVATNMAIHSFNSSYDSYDLNGYPTIDTANDSKYSPISHFNKICQSYGFMKNEVSSCNVKWDSKNKVISVSMGSFVTDWGEKIKPHTQTAKIENM